MRIGLSSSAEIDPEKLRAYLLSATHPVGRFKARFFKALGYSAERWAEFEVDLRNQHLTQDAEPGEVTPTVRRSRFGLLGLEGPNGKSAMVLSVWFVAKAGGPPRFVTAYPGDTK